VIEEFIGAVKAHFEGGDRFLAISAVGGAILLAVLAFLALAAGLMLSWNAFLHGTFGVPTLSLGGACGGLGLLGYSLAAVAAIRDWGDDTGE